MTPNTTARMLTALAAVLMIASTASAQVPGGVPDPTSLPGAAQGLAGSLADADASAATDGSSVDACASAATGTGRVTGLVGAAPVPVPALPVAAPSLPGHDAATGLCVDSDDPEGSATGAVGEVEEQTGEASGFLATFQGWVQGAISGLGLPF